MSSTSTVPVSLAAVQTALGGLVRDRVLTPEQADQVGNRLRPLWAPGSPRSAVEGQAAPTVGGVQAGDRAPATRTGTRLVELVGYLGGAMLLGGAAAVVVPTWDAFSTAVRFMLALIATVLLAAGGIAARRTTLGGEDSRPARLRLGSTLGALAAGAAGTAAAVPAAPAWELLAGSVAALVVAVSGYALVRGTPLLATTWLASVFVVWAGLERADVSGLATWTSAFAALAAVWLLLGAGTRPNLIGEPAVAGLLGGLTGLSAAEAAITGGGAAMAVYGLILGIVFAAACFGLYLARQQGASQQGASRHWPALLPAVLIALVVPATALAILLDSLLAAGVTVALIGLVLLGAGAVLLATRRPESSASAGDGRPPG